MHIHTMGLRQVNEYPFEIYRPKGSGDYLFIYTRTDARIIMNGQDHPFPKHSFILFEKGVEQHYYALPGGYVDDYIHFETNEDFLFAIAPYTPPLNQVITIPFDQSLEMMLEELYMQFISTSYQKEMIIDHLLKAFLLMLADISSVFQTDKNLSGYYMQLKNLRSQIYAEPARHWTVLEMAQEMGLSISYFQKLYRDTFSVSCYNDVIRSKVNYAKTLLASTMHPVKVISVMCGYENDVHFMRQFKQITGDTPSDYRRHLFESF